MSISNVLKRCFWKDQKEIINILDGKKEKFQLTYFTKQDPFFYFSVDCASTIFLTLQIYELNHEIIIEEKKKYDNKFVVRNLNRRTVE